MTDQVEQLKEKILATEKITKEELEQKIKEKLDSLGGLISQEGAIHIIANELSISLHTTPSSELKLKEVLPAMKNVTVLVKVLKKYDVRTFGADQQGKVGSLFVGDETGFIRVTFWNDKTDYLKSIKEGDILQIQHAYAKENNERTEIHMGDTSHCVVNPEGKNVEVKERSPSSQETPEKKLDQILDNDTFVQITATIVQAYDPRFFESCPECNKRMREEDGAFTCPQHGKQEPTFNYVMNVFLDDGTANMRATLWKEQIQQLLAKSDEEVQQLRTDADLLEEVKTDLLGKIISARARVKLNEAYNTKELVLYGIETNPSPKTDQKKESSTLEKDTSEKKDSETQDVQHENMSGKENDSSKNEDTKNSEDITSSNVDEELLSGDDEELLSIDDLDENL